MTIKESIKWWAEEDSIIIDDIGPSLRAIIIRFLMMDKNQSEIERTFGSLQTKACSKRPRIQENSILEEEIVRVFQKQDYIFEEGEHNTPRKKNNLRNGFILSFHFSIQDFKETT